MEAKYAWLAGLWDGEGSIAVFRLKMDNRVKFCPALVLTNCDVSIMNEAEKILLSLGSKFHWFERKQNNGRWKTSYTLTTRNSEYIRKVLTAIMPYLVGKRPQAEIVLRFLDRRDEINPPPHRSKKAGMSEDAELNALCNQILGLNAKGPVSSETTRQAAGMPKI